MNLFHFCIALGIVMGIAVGAGIFISAPVSGGSSFLDDNKQEAQKIIDFRNANHTCNELAEVYLKYEPIKHKSSVNLDWHWETEDRLINDGCISSTELQNLEFINVCMDGRTVGCEISKLENPELYEDFDFETSIKNAIQQKNATESGN